MPGKTPAPAIRASANWIDLGQGTYCVSHAPGSTMPDLSTGFPAVRLSRGPGMGASVATLVGLADDGWVGPPGSAMLVQVHADSARLLMTIYQQGEAEAPKLLIARLGDDATAGARAPGPGASPQPPVTSGGDEVVAHVQGRGDVGGRLGAWVGERGSRRAIEGFVVSPRTAGLLTGDVEYQAILGTDWRSPWIEGGGIAGSRGLGMPILGLRVRLCGDRAATHRLTLAASFIDGSIVGQVGPDVPCQAESLASLEAFCLTITKTGG